MPLLQRSLDSWRGSQQSAPNKRPKGGSRMTLDDVKVVLAALVVCVLLSWGVKP